MKKTIKLNIKKKDNQDWQTTSRLEEKNGKTIIIINERGIQLP